MEECGVCCDMFKNIICCKFCEYKSCKECTKKYLLSVNGDAVCMNPECKKHWEREYLYEILPKTFVNNDYKKYKQNLLFENEIARIPITQEAAIREKERRENAKIIAKKQEKIRELYVEINKIHEEIYRLNTGNTRGSSIDTSYKYKCPSQNCHGFLDNKYFCGLCDKHVCKHCFVELKNNKTHVCNEETVETINEIKKTSKPCPKCGTMISKINGCSQMFCTHCHTAFDWRTGNIETRVIHNPHYFEWLRNNPNSRVTEREPGDVRCGGIARATINVIRSFHTIDSEVEKILMGAFRFGTHIQYVEMPRFRNINDADDNVNLRVSYMLKDINTEEFKKALIRRDTEKFKKRQHYYLYQLLLDTITDGMREVESWRNKCFGINAANFDPAVKEELKADAQKVIKIIHSVYDYVNCNFTKMGKLMNRKIYHIDIYGEMT